MCGNFFRSHVLYIREGVKMINPIQQNVVFKGAKPQASDNFKGTANVHGSVRQDYLNAVNEVNKTQSKMAELNSGKKLDVIA